MMHDACAWKLGVRGNVGKARPALLPVKNRDEGLLRQAHPLTGGRLGRRGILHPSNKVHGDREGNCGEWHLGGLGGVDDPFLRQLTV